MRAPKERFDFVHQFLKRVFIDDLHAKRVLSLANGALGVMTGAALAVSLIGQALAQARGLFAKSAIKQVDRLLSNAGVVPWDLFASWVRELVGERREIVVAMDWTDFDADNQSTLALHLVTRHGRAMPLLWLTVDKDELKNQRNDFEDLCLSRLKALLPDGVAVTILSRDSLNDQRIDSSLPVQGSHGCVDCAVEDVGISEGLMGQMARLEIVPDNLDVVEFGCVFWQPLDGEPVFARLDGFKSELADMDRPVVLDQYDRFYCPSWLRTEQVVELLEVSDEVAAALGLARMHNQLARDMIE